MATEINIKKAVREKIWSKVALLVASGSGKTYSALRLATGMLEKLKEIGLEQNGRIILINTEQKRGYYYANEFDYDIVDLDAPYSPEKYVDLIREVVKLNYPILIIDSTSHEWEGKGGALELHQQAGGTYQAWSKVTPRHDKFILEIADSPIHIIATMRGKDQYSMETEGGRTTVKKLGVGAKQREGVEYEFTVTFLLDQLTNLATQKKDNTHIFDSEGDVILTEDSGRQIISWANSGEAVYIAPKRYEDSMQEDADVDKAQRASALKTEIIGFCKELGGTDNEELMLVLTKYVPSGNPNRIESLDDLVKLNKELRFMIDTKNKQTKKGEGK